MTNSHKHLYILFIAVCAFILTVVSISYFDTAEVVRNGYFYLLILAVLSLGVGDD